MEQTTKPAKVKAPAARGRPRAKEQGIALTTWVPLPTYDRICAMARERDKSVSSIVKSLLILRLK